MIGLVFGAVGLMFGVLLTTVLALRVRTLRWVLAVAFSFRAGAALFHRYVSPLPDGVADAVSFENYAWNLAQQGFFAALAQYPGYGHGWGYPWLVSLAYALADRSPLFMQSLSVIAGTLCVLLAYRLAQRIWGKEEALKAAWLTAVFPMLVMYSALTMREAFIVLALLFALYQAVIWQESDRLGALLLAFVGFLIAGFMHGAMLVGAVMLVLLLLLNATKRLSAALKRGNVSLIGLGLVVVGLVAVLMLASGSLSIPYIGTLAKGLSIDTWIAFAERQAHGGASYPDWLSPENAAHYLLLLPARIAYFIGAPFPWDIRSFPHLLGLVDGLLYLAVSLLIFRNFHAIWRNPAARLVLLICAALVFVYAIGVGNFGTGLRHRAKFIVPALVMAAPWLPKLVFFKKKKPASVDDSNHALPILGGSK